MSLTKILLKIFLPIIVKNEIPKLWEEDNDWMKEWKNRDDLKTYLPYKLPLNDFSDISIINSQEALSKNKDKLTRLADKYNVKDVILCIMSINDDDSININIIYHGTKILKFSSLLKKGPLTPDLLKTIKNEMIQSLWKTWKSQGTILSTQQEDLLCFVETPDLTIWQDIKDRLKKVRVLKGTKLLSLSKGNSQLSLTFLNTINELIDELDQVGLELNIQEIQCILKLK